MLDEWSLFWVGGPVGEASEWLDREGGCGLESREQALGFREGQPILVDPHFRVDPRLSEFFRRSRFARLEVGSQDSYVRDYRLLFTHLWREGRYWDEATVGDLETWEEWRLRGVGNPGRVGGAKFRRELAAFRLLYEWSARRGYVRASPVQLREVRLPGGRVAQVAELTPKNVRSSNVKWVTPRAFRLWRDVGLRGYGADGLPERAWRGRNDGRDAAFADLLFSSGLRRREAGTLLTSELPEVLLPRSYYAGRVASAVAKTSGRFFYVSRPALTAVGVYRVTTRAEAVRKAQAAGRYERLPVRWVVRSMNRAGRLAWVDERGRRCEALLDGLTDRQRVHLYTEGEQGLEPLALWLTETGLPLRYRGWSGIFERASARCARLGLPVFCTPHICRHSFALRMLVTLSRVLDRRLGLTPKERREYEELYGNVWLLVRDLLGHRSEVVTREIYLEPVRGLQLDTLLSGEEEASDNEELLARLAATTGLILDHAQEARV
ncbi:integrase [Streptomyces sp. ISL-99]|uniref:integrase n=1 Tax=Streptomyces sp. ISL-99 TaxID=2819193 RepID=UPI001BEC6B45|nr:integrase [Streptomyces sp. ISL-99]MBT2527498.1 integrase [Streptomyces sp. ISL-99]